MLPTYAEGPVVYLFAETSTTFRVGQKVSANAHETIPVWSRHPGRSRANDGLGVSVRAVETTAPRKRFSGQRAGNRSRVGLFFSTLLPLRPGHILNLKSGGDKACRAVAQD